MNEYFFLGFVEDKKGNQRIYFHGTRENFTDKGDMMKEIMEHWATKNNCTSEFVILTAFNKI